MEEEKLLYALILSLIFAGESFAEDFQQPSEEGMVFAEKMGKDLEVLANQLAKEGNNCKHCSSQIENIEIKNPNSGILVFVSFSMPKAALIELNKQAQKYNATLIMKGIYKNSFSEMRKKILEIEPNGLSINIDPKLFEQYNVKQVPTFIFVENNKEINRLSGNVSLTYANKKLSEAR